MNDLDPAVADEFIDGFLQHYSKYYDPVKAREYYLKNRELKGRQKKGSQIVQPGEKPRRGQPSRAQKVQNTLAKATQGMDPRKTAQVQALAKQAEAKLKSATKDLEGKVSALQKASKTEYDQIAKEMERKLASVVNIPAGTIGTRRTILQAQRTAEIKRIRQEAAKKQAAVNADTKKKMDALRKEVATVRDKVVNEMRDSVQRLRSTKTPLSNQTTVTDR